MKRDITIANLTRSYVERETPETFTPLGALYIAAALEKNDYTVDFRDYLTKAHNRYYRGMGQESGGTRKKRTIGPGQTASPVFPGFYHYVQEGFVEKLNILREEGILNTFMTCSELGSNECRNEYRNENINNSREKGVNHE